MDKLIHIFETVCEVFSVLWSCAFVIGIVALVLWIFGVSTATILQWGGILLAVIACISVLGFAIEHIEKKQQVNTTPSASDNQPQDMPANISFTYRNRSGNVSKRNIINASIDHTYIIGFCTTRNEIRTFRRDRVLQIDQKYRHIQLAPKTSNLKKHVQKIEICFTGFSAADKAELVQIAKDYGMTIRAGVTSNLHYLCCGDNAGPTKIEQAEQQGVAILTEPGFYNLLETGEVPGL